MEALESEGTATIEKPRLLPNETLRKLFLSQTMELGELRRQIPNYNGQNSEVLFNWYCKSDIFNKLKGEVKMEVRERRRGRRIGSKKTERRVSGRIFQDLSFAHSALIQPESQVLLSPQRTLEFFKAIFPEVSIKSHPFKQDSLQIFVPDGLIVEIDEGAIRPVIRQVLEYSSIRGKRGRIFQKKLSSFDQQKKDPKASDFLAGANLKFIVPRADKGSGFTEIGVFDVEQSPFSRSEVRNFMKKNLPKAMKGFPIINNSAVVTAA